MFRTQRDADITIGIYKRIPVLWRDDPDENPWGLSFMAMFHMANDSGLFRTREQLEQDGWILAGNVFRARRAADAAAIRGEADPSLRPSARDLLRQSGPRVIMDTSFPALT